MAPRLRTIAILVALVAVLLACARTAGLVHPNRLGEVFHPSAIFAAAVIRRMPFLKSLLPEQQPGCSCKVSPKDMKLSASTATV